MNQSTHEELNGCIDFMIRTPILISNYINKTNEYSDSDVLIFGLDFALTGSNAYKDWIKWYDELKDLLVSRTAMTASELIIEALSSEIKYIREKAQNIAHLACLSKELITLRLEQLQDAMEKANAELAACLQN